MTSTTPRKTGRPVAVHTTAWGDRIVGLMRLGDGRWRISGPEKYTFTEPDERLAVARFRQWQQARSSSLGQLKAHPDEESAALDMAERAMSGVPSTAVQTADGGVAVADASLTDLQWAWLREQLYTRPEWVAQMAGVAWLAWGPDLKKPKPSPTLEDVGSEYTSRNDVGGKELQKCKATWAEFRRAVGVATLRELTPELVAAFGKKVRDSGRASKTVAHFYHRVKTVLNHYLTTGKCQGDVRHALDCCAVLKTPETTCLDPHPIPRAVFHALVDAATPSEKAMLLVALNAAFYPVDVARLQWSDLDLEQGVYHAKRGKTKVARAAVLWTRTVEALKLLPRVPEVDHVFPKVNGQPHNDNTLRKQFADLRERAVKKTTDPDLKERIGAAQFADIRDGAFTEAAAGEGVEFRHAQVLAGHRSGIADSYILRAPRQVSKACAAIELAYFG